MSNEQKILIIEDEEDLAEAIKIKLESSGFATEVALDGESGLKAAIAHQPDLILLDIVLPGMTGIEVLDKLREDEWGKNASVIFLTNMDDDKSIAQAMVHQSSGYIVKSNTKLDEIVDKVKMTLEEGKNIGK